MNEERRREAFEELIDRFSVGQLVEAIVGYGYGTGEELHDWLTERGVGVVRAQDTVDTLQRAHEWMKSPARLEPREYMLTRGEQLDKVIRVHLQDGTDTMMANLLLAATNIPREGVSLGLHGSFPGVADALAALRECFPFDHDPKLTSRDIAWGCWHNLFNISRKKEEAE